MSADLAAAYCGETYVDEFLKRVGGEYPNPRFADGRRQFWLKEDLDSRIAPSIVPNDLAEDL